ncbi:hypothetical protein [Streptomyces sp. NPDC001530]|uniref:hypothetical protein n=1 Tax=Streptomyces sp. NPDC001530 TaxID=3364582 RepID=UPI0036AA9FF9
MEFGENDRAYGYGAATAAVLAVTTAVPAGAAYDTKRPLTGSQAELTDANGNSVVQAVTRVYDVRQAPVTPAPPGGSPVEGGTARRFRIPFGIQPLGRFFRMPRFQPAPAVDN